MVTFDGTSMDKAANDASLELAKIREEHPEGVQAIEDWIKKWLSAAGYKRLAKILAGRWD